MLLGWILKLHQIRRNRQERFIIILIWKKVALFMWKTNEVKLKREKMSSKRGFCVRVRTDFTYTNIISTLLHLLTHTAHTPCVYIQIYKCVYWERNREIERGAYVTYVSVWIGFAVNTRARVELLKFGLFFLYILLIYLFLIYIFVLHMDLDGMEFSWMLKEWRIYRKGINLEGLGVKRYIFLRCGLVCQKFVNFLGKLVGFSLCSLSVSKLCL